MNIKVMDAGFIIRTIYSLCLSGASYNHAMINIEHGLFWDYYGASLLTCIYWTSLTFLDPLAVVLLFVKPRLGVMLTAIIIFTDVLHNSWFLIVNGHPLDTAYFAQVGFLIFVSLTMNLAWKYRRVD